MASWTQLLTGTEPGEHIVELYAEDDQLLTRNVSRYLLEGLRRGEGLVVIDTPEHTRDVARHLVEEEPDGTHLAVASGRLRYLDAEATLAAMLAVGLEDLDGCRSLLGDILAGVRVRSTTGSVRAFGEMVSLLWEETRREEAARLEELWNTVLMEHRCSLFCAYRIDLFDRHRDAAALQPIVSTHHHILAGAGTLLSSGLSRT